VSDPLEELLLRQPLNEPPASLDRRVRHRFLERRVRQAWKRWRWPTATAGVLAAGLLAAFYWQWRPLSGGPKPPADSAPSEQAAAFPASAPAAAAHPVRMEYNRSVLLDDGVVVLENNTAVRQLRQLTMRHVFWNDPAQNVRIEANLPCEQVVLVREATY